MNVFTILEVAIGIIFVWFLISMLVSTVQEAVANIFQWRSKALEKFIGSMLADPELQRRTNIQLGREFYNHPLIRDLALDMDKRRPSYIPAGHFAQVIFDLLVDAGKPSSRLKEAADLADRALTNMDVTIKDAADKAFSDLLGHAQLAMEGGVLSESITKALDDEAHKLAEEFPDLSPAIQQLHDTLANHDQLGAQVQQLASTLPGSRPLVGQLTAGVAAFTFHGSELGRTFNVLVSRAIENARDADDALGATRKNVETWFDSSMERLTGYYKRRVQIFAFSAGVLVALLFNVDSLAIARTLWLDQTLRSAIVAEAGQTVQAGQQAAQGKTAGQIIQTVSALNIPAGWVYIKDDALCSGYLGAKSWSLPCIYPAGSFNGYKLFEPVIWQSLAGILITGIATLQGAPFWFGLLSRLVNLRASVTPTAEKAK